MHYKATSSVCYSITYSRISIYSRRAHTPRGGNHQAPIRFNGKPSFFDLEPALIRAVFWDRSCCTQRIPPSWPSDWRTPDFNTRHLVCMGAEDCCSASPSLEALPVCCCFFSLFAKQPLDCRLQTKQDQSMPASTIKGRSGNPRRETNPNMNLVRTALQIMVCRRSSELAAFFLSIVVHPVHISRRTKRRVNTIR